MCLLVMLCLVAGQAGDGPLFAADIGGETGEATAQRVGRDVRKVGDYRRHEEA
jgi:hypothetical protein